MSWGAVDQRLHSHRKILRLRCRKKCYGQAVGLWTLAMSWCCDQEREQWTGEVGFDVLDALGIPDWLDAMEALVDVGLWERVDDETIRFHDWAHWNGVGGREYRSKEAARVRQAERRRGQCEQGSHDRHCPSETCPEKARQAAAKAAREAKKEASERVGHSGSRDPGPVRSGSVRGSSTTKPSLEEGTRPLRIVEDLPQCPVKGCGWLLLPDVGCDVHGLPTPDVGHVTHRDPDSGEPDVEDPPELGWGVDVVSDVAGPLGRVTS